jgi:hypothetical protein
MTSTNTVLLQPKNALIELTLLNAEYFDDEFDDMLITGLKRDIPPEVLTRLLELWIQTKEVAGDVIAIGKIIVRKIIDFLLENRQLTMGMALGAALGVLVSSIPVIGPFLAPLVATVSMLYGASVGANMQKGNFATTPVTEAIELASLFFELLVAIFNGVAEYWNSKA